MPKMILKIHLGLVKNHDVKGNDEILTLFLLPNQNFLSIAIIFLYSTSSKNKIYNQIFFSHCGGFEEGK